MSNGFEKIDVSNWDASKVKVNSEPIVEEVIQEEAPAVEPQESATPTAPEAPQPDKVAATEEQSKETPAAQSPEPAKENPWDKIRATLGYEDTEKLIEDYQTLKQKAETSYEFKDDFIKNLVSRYEQGEDLTPYIRAKALDVDKLKEEEVIREKVKRDNPDMPDKFVGRKVQEYMSKFKLDPDEYDPEEVEYGKYEFKKAVAQLREELKEEQSKFLAPPAEERGATKEQQDLYKQQVEHYHSILNASKDINRVKEEGILEVKYGEGAFNYEVDNREELLEDLSDLTTNRFYQNFQGEDGKPNLKKMALVYAFAKNPDKFVTELMKYGRTLGKDEILDEIKNPSQKETESVTTGPKDFLHGLGQAIINEKNRLDNR